MTTARGRKNSRRNCARSPHSFRKAIRPRKRWKAWEKMKAFLQSAQECSSAPSPLRKRFGFLKKAVTGFVGKLTGKEEEKKEAEIPQEREKQEEPRAQTPKETAEEKIEDEIVKQAEKEVLREEKEIEHKAIEQKIERRVEEKERLQPQPVLHEQVEKAKPQAEKPAELAPAPEKAGQRKPVFEVKH